MTTLKLIANNSTEEKVLAYLQENASPMLADKINAGTKTLEGCMEYAKRQAEKLANGASSLCVDDQTVYGWIIHFFEEEDIHENIPPKHVKKVRTLAPQPVKKPEPKTKQKPDPKPMLDESQMTLIEELFK